MKDASWNDCLNNSTVQERSSDTERAISLREIAEERVNLIKDIDAKNCNFVFEDYYTSLLELLQAILCKEGYKVRNHLCLGYYLRDILQREDLYRVFDDVRYKRNALMYYGNRMELATATDAIKKCKKMMKDLHKILTK